MCDGGSDGGAVASLLARFTSIRGRFTSGLHSCRVRLLQSQVVIATFRRYNAPARGCFVLASEPHHRKSSTSHGATPMSESIFDVLIGGSNLSKRPQKPQLSTRAAGTKPGEAQVDSELEAGEPEESVQLSGSTNALPVKDFSTIVADSKHSKKILHNIAECGFHRPTTVQQHAMAGVLDGQDMYVIAPTGSGKTLAFLLPGMLLAQQERAAAQKAGPSILVLNPTRELAAQSYRVLKLLICGTGISGSLLCKSTAAGTNFSAVDILIATPLLLVQLIREGKVDLSHLRLLVLDEADKVLQSGKGFMEQVDVIYAACSKSPRLSKCLFSATLPDWVEQIASSMLHSPTSVIVGAKNVSSLNVEQSLLFVGQEAGKVLALRQMLTAGFKPPILVFVSSKERAKALHAELKYESVHVDSIHADQSQAARAAAITSFRKGSTWVLIATDLLARGMDFLGVQTVINYDFPNTKTDYIHRVGRTGRGGRRGKAITLFVEDDSPRLQAIADCMRKAGCHVPEWMLTLKRGHSKRPRAQKAAKPRTILGGQTAYDKQKRAHKLQIIRQSKEKKQKVLSLQDK